MVAIAVAAYGFYMTRYSQKKHGWSLFTATLVNLAAIFILMTPRLISHIPEIDLMNLSTHAAIILVILRSEGSQQSSLRSSP